MADRKALTTEVCDCVVIGAGWYGLAAAKQYHVTNPEQRLLVLDSQPSLGGTWADHRLYPGLKSNNLLGTYEYPDFPMDPAKFAVQPGQHITGQAINAYLKAYANQFDISRLIRLNTKVLSAEHQDTAEGGWMLATAATTTTGKNGEKQDERSTRRIFARRLILATGLTSEAFLPHFAGQEEYGRPIFHSKQFQQHAGTLDTAKTVTIFGASKFAWDATYAYATAGVKVNWVIRSSGHGPCWMSPPYVTPFKRWVEKLANTRAVTWFSPCIWGDADGYPGVRHLLHGTAIGRSIVDAFWATMSNDIESLNQYDAHPETAKLKPWIPAMFAGPSISTLNYETNFFDLVKDPNKVTIHVGEINHLSPGRVHLADGTSFESDALLANTGWKHVPPIRFLPEGIEKELGLPHTPLDHEERQDLMSQNDLVKRADAEILERFPRLRRQPTWNKNYVPLTEQEGIDSPDPAAPSKNLTPYMLHRFMVPPSARFLRTRDIAFCGIISNLSNTLTGHLQGLWISAYFTGRLVRDPSAALDAPASSDARSDALAKLRYETVLHNRFGNWRYPTDWGNRYPAFTFDVLPYLDLLQLDLGLQPFRKGLVLEMFSSYGVEDYRNVTQEWLLKFAGVKADQADQDRSSETSDDVELLKGPNGPVVVVRSAGEAPVSGQSKPPQPFVAVRDVGVAI